MQFKNNFLFRKSFDWLNSKEDCFLSYAPAYCVTNHSLVSLVMFHIVFQWTTNQDKLTKPANFKVSCMT